MGVGTVCLLALYSITFQALHSQDICPQKRPLALGTHIYSNNDVHHHYKYKKIEGMEVVACDLKATNVVNAKEECSFMEECVGFVVVKSIAYLKSCDKLKPSILDFTFYLKESDPGDGRLRTPESLKGTRWAKSATATRRQHEVDGQGPAPGPPLPEKVMARNRPANMSSSRHPDMKHILIISTSRSGSSAVGNVFDSHPDALYLFEPFKYTRTSDDLKTALTGVFDCSVWDGPGWREKIVWGYAKSQMSWAKTKGHWKFRSGELCKSRRMHAYKIIRLNEGRCEGGGDGAWCGKGCNVATDCYRRNRPGAHAAAGLDIAIAASGAAQHGADLRMIHLVRHPGAIWASQNRMRWRWKRTDDDWMADICGELYHRTLALRQRFSTAGETPHLLEMKFEDFAADTTGWVKRMLHFSGAHDTSPKDLAAIVARVSEHDAHKHTKKTKKHKKRKSAAELAHSWQRSMSSITRLAMRKHCTDFCSMFDYKNCTIR